MPYKSKTARYIALLMFVSLITLSFAQAQVIKPRIINGSPGFTANYPWMASITIDTPDGMYENGCGGSLIARDWILTAAHCFLNEAGDAVDPTAVNRTVVLLNSDTQNPQAYGSFSVMARQVIVHPNYNPDPLTNPNNNDFDVALIELDSYVDLPTIPLAAATSTLIDGTQTIIMGWGTTGVNAYDQSINPSNSLLQAQQETISQSECNVALDGFITENMLCAGAIEPDGTTDACQGDSGGPMLVSSTTGFTQVGIVSFGGVCGIPDEPGVYTRISNLNDFISQYATNAVFQDVTPLQYNCTNSALDTMLNITIPCLEIGGQTVGLQLTLVDQTNLLWQWNGLLDGSACAGSNPLCATLSDDLTLTIPGVAINGSPYTLQLAFSAANSSDEKIIWQYITHY